MPKCSSNILDLFFNKSKESIDPLLSDLDDESLLSSETDPTLALYKKVIDLEEIVINNYTSRIAILVLLVKKNILTMDEFNQMYEKLKQTPEIKKLYDNIQEEKSIFNNVEDLFNE